MQNKILIIDDDRELCRLLAKCLDKEGFAVDCSYTGTGGLELTCRNNYSLMVLDVMLPGMNGFEVLANTRKNSTVPVLMLTAKDSPIDKVSGLRLGADDYLTKPFNIDEFIARVQALIRRSTVLNSFDNSGQETLYFKGLSLDTRNRRVELEGGGVELTAKEFDLLCFLASHKGQVFTKKQIYRQVWNEEYAFDDSNIMSFMSKLRKKLEKESGSPEYIQTVWGVGYRFNPEV